MDRYSPDAIFLPDTTVDIYNHPGTLISDYKKPTYHLFFIPGNPGLITYYKGFLKSLRLQLSVDTDCKTRDVKFHVLGTSLGGFELDHYKNACDPVRTAPPYSLKEQVAYVERRIRQHVDRCHEELPADADTGYVKGEPSLRARKSNIILVGHSVGTYIALEVIRRLQEKRREGAGKDANWGVVGGIMLFPTIVDIAKSPMGARLAWLVRTPNFALIISWLAKLLLGWLPVEVLVLIVQLATMMPSTAAAVTVNFLQSRWGVRQALHMAKDEMNEMTTDKWGHEVWGSVRSGSSNLTFYFAKEDHWIAKETRDQLIAARGGTEEWHPRMVVDGGAMKHAFCLKEEDSVSMAERVAEYAKGVVAVHEISKANASAQQ